MRFWIMPLLPAFCLILAACGPSQQPAGSSEGSNNADEHFEWKLVTSWPKNYPGLGTAPEHLAREVDRMTNGRLKIRVYGAGELVGPFEVFDAVSLGTAEMGHSAAYYWRGKSPASAFFTAVPFGLTAKEMNGWLHFGGGMELWRELYRGFGLYPLAAGSTGVQMAGWFNREINSLADLKGLKMRIPGLGGEIFNRAGGTAVSMPGGEIYTSMQTGVIDATEWVGPYNDKAFGLHEVAKYYYYPGWHEPGPILELIINLKAWESLPDDLKAIVENAAAAVNQYMLDEYTAHESAALKELVEQHGVELRKLPDDVLAEFYRLSEEVYAEYAADDPFTRRVYESFSKFREGAIGYHRISELAYGIARERLMGAQSRSGSRE